MRSVPMTLMMIFGLAVAVSLPSQGKAAVGGGDTGLLYETLTKQYMSGKWDELEETLKAKTKELNALSGPQKLDVAYIRQSMAESRPAWWKLIKSGSGKTNFRAMIWGRSLDLIHDPAGQGGVQTKWNNNRAEVYVSWPSADMDNAAHAEHGFSKGELNNLGVFCTLGTAGLWTTVSPQALANLNEAQKTQLLRAVDFHGNVAGVYYGNPRARQWGLWLYMHSYLEKYAKMQTVNGRKAVAAAFLIEVVSNPKKYPSIKLPDQIDAENTEEKLALAVHKPIEKQGWTLAEDKSIREALRTLAKANEGILQSGVKVNLPGGLAISLDPDQDAPLRAKRDAWFKKTIEKAREGK